MSTIVPPPGSELPQHATDRLDALPVDELARLWCAVQQMGIKERLDPEKRFASLLLAERYFRHLPHKTPERTFALICAVLASQTPDAIKIQLCDGLMAPLIYVHGAEMADAIGREAKRAPRMRWLMGGAFEWTYDETLLMQLEKHADVDRWASDRWNLNQVAAVDFGSLPTPDLARAWIIEKSKPSWLADDNTRALQDFEGRLRDDPLAALALVAEIASIEDNGVLLYHCAAPLLADVLTEGAIERIERIANEKIATMLTLVDYSDIGDEPRKRLVAVERKHLKGARPSLMGRPIKAGNGFSLGLAWANKPLPRVEMMLSGPGFFDEPGSVRIGRRATVGPKVRMALDKLPIGDLAHVWCASQFTDLRRQTEETRSIEEYFDYLPHEQPARALALAIAVLCSDADTIVKMELENKFIGIIINTRDPHLIDAVEAEAGTNPQMRWLLGAIGWAIADNDIKDRLARFADKDAWRADEVLQASPPDIDFASLSTAELARTFVELHTLHHKLQFRNRNYDALVHFQQRLAKKNLDAAIDLILEVLEIEPNLALLEILARSVLFRVVRGKSIGRIMREAARNERFAWMMRALLNHWPNPPSIIRKQLNAIRQNAEKSSTCANLVIGDPVGKDLVLK